MCPCVDWKLTVPHAVTIYKSAVARLQVAWRAQRRTKHSARNVKLRKLVSKRSTTPRQGGHTIPKPRHKKREITKSINGKLYRRVGGGWKRVDGRPANGSASLKRVSSVRSKTPPRRAGSVSNSVHAMELAAVLAVSEYCRCVVVISRTVRLRSTCNDGHAVLRAAAARSVFPQRKFARTPHARLARSTAIGTACTDHVQSKGPRLGQR